MPFERTCLQFFHVYYTLKSNKIELNKNKKKKPLTLEYSPNKEK